MRKPLLLSLSFLMLASTPLAQAGEQEVAAINQLAAVLGHDLKQMREFRDLESGDCAAGSHHLNLGKQEFRGLFDLQVELREPGTRKVVKTLAFALSSHEEESFDTTLLAEGNSLQIQTNYIPNGARREQAVPLLLRVERKASGLAISVTAYGETVSCAGLKFLGNP